MSAKLSTLDQNRVRSQYSWWQLSMIKGYPSLWSVLVHYGQQDQNVSTNVLSPVSYGVQCQPASDCLTHSVFTIECATVSAMQ